MSAVRFISRNSCLPRQNWIRPSIKLFPVGASRCMSSDSTSSGGTSTVTEKAKNMVHSILHGAEGDAVPITTVKDTHSKLLERGKFVHEMQTHSVKPEAWEDYLGLVNRHYARIADDPHFQVRLFGSWETEIGPLDTAIHIWEYNNYPGYIKTMEALKTDDKYQEFLRQLRPMLRSRNNQIMLEFAYWNPSGAAQLGGIYELRSYQLQGGRLLEWEQEWRRGLEARRKFTKPIGAWFSQLGDLNMVHHIWQYPDLHTRKKTREAGWQVDGWAKTVANTVKLVKKMECKIMRPTDCSPLK